MFRFWRRRTHGDFADEIQAHLDHEADRLVAEGNTPGNANDAAHRAFGNVARARERFYEASRWMWLEHLVHDGRYAWRGLLHSPAFLATTVLTLAVGLGLVTVAFSVFNAYVLRPYAVRDPYGLHRLAWTSPDGGGQRFRWRDYLLIKDRHDLFTAVVAEHTRFMSSQGRPLATGLVSEDYFEALAPAMTLGRPTGLGDVDAVVLSHQAWSRLFASDPSAVGRTIDVSGRPFTIVGVVGPEFTGLGDMPRDLWASYPAFAAVFPETIAADTSPALELTTRLRPGLSVDHVAAALTPQIQQALTGVVERATDVRAEVTVQASPNPLSLSMLAILSPVFAAFVLVLVTACANVSNVMLARAIARHREIAVRLSLGASRGRVIRQLLTEGLLISLLSGLCGLALATLFLRGALTVMLGTLPPSVAALIRVDPIGLDARVFLFALAVAGATTLLFALFPAIQASRLTLTAGLRGQGVGTRKSTMQNALVVAQVAVSIVLVIVALTLARNGAAIGSIDLGYETSGVLSVNVREGRADLMPRLAELLGSEPSVAEFAAATSNPLFVRTRAIAATSARIPGAKAARYTFVSPAYFSVLRIPINRGRAFRQEEAIAAAPVAIVSDAAAQEFWPGEDPVGQTLTVEPAEGRPVDDLPGYTRITVIGTVRDVVSGLVVDGRDTAHVYLPTLPDDPRAHALLVRGRTTRDLRPDVLQQLFRHAAPDPETFEALPLEELHALQVYPLRAASWIGCLLAGVALALSVSGLYGVLTYTLNQRTKEIGIRIALGATSRLVVRMVMSQSARLAGIGAALGLTAAYLAMRTLSTAVQLREVSVLDLAAFAAGVMVIVGAAGLAAYHPARRATRVSPSLTLRADG
jgi:predicted permease